MCREVSLGSGARRSAPFTSFPGRRSWLMSIGLPQIRCKNQRRRNWLHVGKEAAIAMVWVSPADSFQTRKIAWSDFVNRCCVGKPVRGTAA